MTDAATGADEVLRGAGADGAATERFHDTRRDQSVLGGNLPELGRRGGGWVAIQGLLIIAAILAGLLGRRWPHPVRGGLRAVGPLVGLPGLFMAISGSRRLGHQLTPYPRPVADGELKRDGIYGQVRHPLYGGGLLLLLGWSFVSSPLALGPFAASAAFLSMKRRREEAWLIAEHPEYADYMREVKHSFVPRVW